jgi:hypothetical protein
MASARVAITALNATLLGMIRLSSPAQVHRNTDCHSTGEGKSAMGLRPSPRLADDPLGLIAVLGSEYSIGRQNFPCDRGWNARRPAPRPGRCNRCGPTASRIR